MDSNTPSISSCWMIYKNYCSLVCNSSPVTCIFLDASKTFWIQDQNYVCSNNFKKQLFGNSSFTTSPKTKILTFSLKLYCPHFQFIFESTHVNVNWIFFTIFSSESWDLYFSRFVFFTEVQYMKLHPPFQMGWNNYAAFPELLHIFGPFARA